MAGTSCSAVYQIVVLSRIGCDASIWRWDAKSNGQARRVSLPPLASWADELSFWTWRSAWGGSVRLAYTDTLDGSLQARLKETTSFNLDWPTEAQIILGWDVGAGSTVISLEPLLGVLREYLNEPLSRLVNSYWKRVAHPHDLVDELAEALRLGQTLSIGYDIARPSVDFPFTGGLNFSPGGKWVQGQGTDLVLFAGDASRPSGKFQIAISVMATFDKANDSTFRCFVAQFAQSLRCAYA